jgi:hypothetical protein
MSQRAVSMRRLRRRASSRPLYCSTNGCASFLTLDATTGVARCRVCGYERRVH